MNRRDLVLAVLICLVALGLFFFYQRGETGDVVRITLDGVTYGEYPLSLDKEILVESENEDGFNLVVIRGGEVWIKEADCPDKYCVKQGVVSKEKESLICLPHKLIVEVQGASKADTTELDGVVSKCEDNDDKEEWSGSNCTAWRVCSLGNDF